MNMSNLFKKETPSTPAQKEALASNSEVLGVLGTPVAYAPQYVEGFYEYTVPIAERLVATFPAENQRNSREGNILYLAVQNLKNLILPELRSVDFQGNRCIDGLHFLKNILLSRKSAICRTRFWAPDVDVMSKIDQGVARTIRDFYKVTTGECDKLLIGAMGVIKYLFTGDDSKLIAELLRPYMEFFGGHYEAVSPCLSGKFRNPIWAAILTLAHAIDADRALKMGYLVVNNSDCERGSLLYKMATTLRDRKGRLPTGTAARAQVIAQLFTGAIYYISRGNVKIDKLQPSKNAIEEALRAMDVEVVTLDTLRADFERLQNARLD